MKLNLLYISVLCLVKCNETNKQNYKNYQSTHRKGTYYLQKLGNFHNEYMTRRLFSDYYVGNQLI
jgi:hypothetical protein